MYIASPNLKGFGYRLTVGIEGSFGILYYAALAFEAAQPAVAGQADGQRWPLPALELLGRGFKPARTPDLQDVVLKAQLADGSVRCRASTEGLVLLLVDNNLVWSRQLDPQNRDSALWLKAAGTREVTLLSGDLHTKEAGDGYSPTTEPLMIAKVPTEWTR
ncbi:hypothetical protein FDW83_10635 [Pseudarthrobacter sp. NamE2]|nr:hypothetical protein FDW83_10635 [Pseudarthrobacter sp. NamE2]